MCSLGTDRRIRRHDEAGKRVGSARATGSNLEGRNHGRFKWSVFCSVIPKAVKGTSKVAALRTLGDTFG